MAYNTTTERLLNAIKTNPANTNVTLTGNITAVDETTQTAIKEAAEALISNSDVAGKITLFELLQVLNYVTADAAGTEQSVKLLDLKTALEALTADNAANPGTDTTLEDLRTLLATIDGDTSNISTKASDIDTSLNNIETNSNTSLGKNGFTYHTETLTTDTSGRAAVQFVVESVVGGIKIGSTSTGVAGTLPAGTIIYGDITNVTMTAGAGGFILYNE